MSSKNANIDVISSLVARVRGNVSASIRVPIGSQLGSAMREVITDREHVTFEVGFAKNGERVGLVTIWPINPNYDAKKEAGKDNPAYLEGTSYLSDTSNASFTDRELVQLTETLNRVSLKLGGKLKGSTGSSSVPVPTFEDLIKSYNLWCAVPKLNKGVFSIPTEEGYFLKLTLTDPNNPKGALGVQRVNGSPSDKGTKPMSEAITLLWGVKPEEPANEDATNEDATNEDATNEDATNEEPATA